MTCAALLQARMGSSRLPGKVLADLAGKPVLLRIVERLKQCRHVDRIVVATTALPEDDPIAEAAESFGVVCFRGAVDDVVGRICAAVHATGDADWILHATGDNPLIDPELAEQLLTAAQTQQADFTFMTGIPVGSGVDIYRSELLERINREATAQVYREHLNAWLFDNKKLFRLCAISAPERWSGSAVRLTVDYQEDLQLVRELYRQLENGDVPFGLAPVLELLRSNPELTKINGHIVQQYVSPQAATLRHQVQ